MASGVISFISNILTIRSNFNSDWKSLGMYSCKISFYEIADSSVIQSLDLPYGYVFVISMKATNNRGIAIAIKWADTKTAIWINRLHDSWKGWETVYV